MNKVYKLIFNVTTGTWAVAHELASSRGKKSRSRLAIAMAVALALPSFTAGASVLAPPGCTAPVDGSGWWSLVAGCSASGGNVLAATALGTATSVSADFGSAVGLSAKVSGYGGTAIGAVAYVTAKNSVALGTGSVADAEDTVSIGRAASSGNTGPDTGAGWDASLVSGALTRRLTNMSAGTDNTDAVNVAQLKGVAAALGGSAGVASDGSITAPTYTLDGDTVTARTVEAAVTNLDGRITTNAASVSTLKTQVENGTVGLLKQDGTTGAITVAGDKTGTSVSFAGVDATGTATNRTLTGVANGAVSASSADAVNGSQLFTTNTNVGTNTTNITTNTTSIGTLKTQVEDGTVGLVQQDANTGAITVAGDKTGTSVSFAGVNATGTATNRTLTGVANGAVSASSADAVNGSQLFATNTNVATNATNITTLGTRVTRNEGDISDLQGQIGAGTVGLVQQDANTGAITVAKTSAGTSVDFAGTAGVRTLSGIKDGALSATSTEAVTGKQLHASNERLSAAEGDMVSMKGDMTRMDGSMTQLSSRTTITEGNISNLSQQFNELSNGSVGIVTHDAASGAVNVAAQLGGSVVSLAGTDGDRRISGVANGTEDSDAATVAQLKASGLVDPNDGRALGALVYDDMSLDRATLGGSNGTVIANLGNGLIAAGSREAVNGGQLWQMNADWEARWNALDGRVVTIEQGVADGSIGGGSGGPGVAPGAGDGSVQIGDGAAAGGSGSVAIGEGAAGAGDGSIAIGDGASAEGTGSVAIGEGASASGDNSVAIGKGSTAAGDNEFSVGSEGGERVISNVAAGTRPTDAVNVQQMEDRFTAERNWAEGQFQAVNERFDRMGAMSAAYAGMALNTAGLSGENRVGAGVGSQNGRTALAVGYQRILGEKKNISVSLGGAFSGSDQSLSAGAGYSW